MLGVIIASSSRFFSGASDEDVSSWLRLVESEFMHLGIYEDEMRAVYAWQGLLGDALY